MDEEMKSYIGAKIIKAKPMTEREFWPNDPDRKDNPGYVVRYPDGYISWAPKAVFEEAYRPISVGEKALI